MRVLITLGPTREPIDAVRYITNPSSGKMGLALVEEALRRGHEATAVAGPVGLEFPEGCKLRTVRTAAEMIDATLEELEKGHDALISAAAIVDYSPVEPFRGKLPSDEEEINLRLRRNPKLTKLARQRFPELLIAAFKAEYGIPAEELVRRAKQKLEEEELDLVVANDLAISWFGSDEAKVWLVGKACVKELPLLPKRKVAEAVLKELEALRRVRRLRA